MYRLTTILACAVALMVAGLTPASAGAQERGRSQERERSQEPAVPRGYEPPRGMCRIWITGVPPAQQPAPTDCATAIRRRPSNGRVVFGPSVRPEPAVPPVKELTPPRKQEAPSRTPEKAQPRPERRGDPPSRGRAESTGGRSRGEPSSSSGRRRGPPDSE